MEKPTRYHHVPLSETDSMGVSSQAHLAWRQQRVVRCGLLIFSALSIFGLGCFIGTQMKSASRRAQFEPSGELHYYMRFNGSFAQGSNAKIDALWDSLFPEKLGFIQHPKLAPNVAGIAVFHELHCLNILRQAFYASVNGQLKQMSADTQDAIHRTSTHHIRHCLEYLRQSLMCLADANLEEMNYTTRGVSGWQKERTCGDFEGLKTWADRWGIARDEALQNWTSMAVR
ncbi:hypothetical protein MGU_01320 [Metarhizium guizhouense ARSEF 977]|uniref:Tat pathway signal sequence n=1 Tax=Metarhizium guizhouense (strain ARSEF 977) TaxID=1276136 RepID=A0A0B4GUZ1_METGA|nr:hypothetical protein MGU_01320 [Metarhizium guizhouense ARSEF 977]